MVSAALPTDCRPDRQAYQVVMAWDGWLWRGQPGVRRPAKCCSVEIWVLGSTFEHGGHGSAPFHIYLRFVFNFRPSNEMEIPQEEVLGQMPETA
jgi:hypothetical protein